MFQDNPQRGIISATPLRKDMREERLAEEKLGEVLGRAKALRL